MLRVRSHTASVAAVFQLGSQRKSLVGSLVRSGQVPRRTGFFYPNRVPCSRALLVHVCRGGEPARPNAAVRFWTFSRCSVSLPSSRCLLPCRLCSRFLSCSGAAVCTLRPQCCRATMCHLLPQLLLDFAVLTRDFSPFCFLFLAFQRSGCVLHAPRAPCPPALCPLSLPSLPPLPCILRESTPLFF